MKTVIKPEWKYNALYILTWYFFSTALSVYNKTLMGKDHYNFNLPLLMSAVHSGTHTLITRVFIKYSNQKVQRYSNMEYFIKVVSAFIQNHALDLIALCIGALWDCSGRRNMLCKCLACFDYTFILYHDQIQHTCLGFDVFLLVWFRKAKDKSNCCYFFHRIWCLANH